MMSSSLKFAFRVILCFVVFSTSNQSAPGYVFEHNGYDYKFVFPEDDQRTWYEAETLCKSEQNGHLASLVTAAEISWADSVIKNVQEGVSSKVRLWIGGSDRQISDVWHFIDDKPLHYNQVPWAPGQPFRPKRVYYEFCISLEFNGERSTWYVEDCFKAHGYICKSLDPPRRLTDQKLFGYSWEWGRNVYKFIPLPWDALSWTEAEIYCREMEGGHLLSIRTRKESRWVTDRIRQIRRVLGFSRFWMGASDFGHQGEYKWSDKNRPVTFTKWKSGEPSSFSNNRKEDCVAILADPDWGKWSDESCVMETPFACKTRVCMGKTDLAFIIDSSGSVGEDNFVEAKNFIWAVARNFDISNRNTRLAILRFSTRAHVIFDFKFSANNNVQRLKEMVDNIEYVEGGTKTERALQLAYTDLFSDKGGSRPDVPRILILMTDGKSERALAVAERSTALKRDKKVTIVAVGIGEEVDMEELFSMASSTEDAINVSSFKELKKRVGNIRDKVCDEIIENQNKRDIEEEERNQQGRTTR